MRRDDLKAKLDALNEKIQKLESKSNSWDSELMATIMYRNYIDRHIALYDGKFHKNIMCGDDIGKIMKHLENLTDIYGYYIPVEIKDERQLVSDMLDTSGCRRDYEVGEFARLRQFYEE